MKYWTFLITLFLSFSASSQQWPQPNAEWTYCSLSNNDFENFFFAGPFKVIYINDTIIGGVTYNVSQKEGNPYSVYITRYSNDTVYRWVNNQEYLFFHFKMNMGEVITTYRSVGPSSDTSCSSILPLEVIDSTTVNINGQNLTRWRLIDTLGFDPNNTGSPYYEDYYIYEYFGFASYPWFASSWELPNCQTTTDAGYNYLDGYNDDSFPEWIANCPTANLENLNSQSFLLYPNPANETLTIQLENPVSDPTFVSVYTLSGSQIYKATVQKNLIELDVGEFERGAYLVYLVTDDRVIAKKLVIE